MFALNNNDPLLHWVKKSQLSNGLLLSIKSQTMEDLFKNKVEVSQQWAAVINSGRMLTSKILCKLPPAVNNSGPLFDWIWPFIICPLLLTTNLSWPQLRVKSAYFEKYFQKLPIIRFFNTFLVICFKFSNFVGLSLLNSSLNTVSNVFLNSNW